MNRVLKFAVVLLAILVLLVVIAAALIPRLIDPNQFREDITEMIYEQSGLQVAINGPIDWSVFPWIRLSLNDVSVTGANQSPMAKLDSAGVSVKLIPLLRNRIEMQTVELNGLKLTLVKDKSGQGNWEITPSKSLKSSSADDSQAAANDKEDSPVVLNIASININDLLVSYDDQQAGQTYVINQASLSTGPIRSTTPFSFHMKAHVQMPERVLNTSITGNMTLNLEAGTYRLDKLNMSVSPDVAKAETISLVGNLMLQQEPALIQGNLAITPFNAANLAKQIKLDLPPMADPKALTRVAFNSHFNTNGKSLNAEQVKLQLDDFTLDGNFKISDLSRSNMKFAFKGDYLNLDRYLPPAVEPTSDSLDSSPSREEKASALATELPIIPEDALRTLNLDGTLELSTLTVAKFDFDKPSVAINAAYGKQNVKLSSHFYQGTIDLTSTLDVRQKGKPSMTANANLKAIDIHALGKPVPEFEALEGRVNAAMKVKSYGQYASTLTKNLNGDIRFNIDKGAFLNANFDKMVCKAVASVRKKELQSKDWGKATRFTDLSGTFVITNGVAKNSDLIAALANMNLKGDGYVNLVSRKMDYHMGLNIRGEESPDSDPACQINKDYVNVTWPLRCEGALDSPECGVDGKRIGETIKDIAGNRLQKKIEEKVQGPVKDLLKGLFKQ